MDKRAEIEVVRTLGRIAVALERINVNLVQIGQNMKGETDDGAGNS